MHVTKRDGSTEPVILDKITRRISTLCDGPGGSLERVDPIIVATKVVSGLFDGVTTTQLDELAIQTAASLTTTDIQYNTLAARIAVSNLHKSSPSTFSEAITQLHEYRHPITGAAGVISDQLFQIVIDNKDYLDSIIQADRDYNYSYFGFKTLERAYLLKCGGEIIERPCYMLLRVSIGIHGTDLESAVRMYNSMSQQLYTAATPTLFNAGTKRPQCSSCFLLDMSDSIEDIYKVLSQTAVISKNSGGIGINCHDIRASGSHISGTGGTSNGILPMLRTFNASSRYIDQGGGKRPGSVAFYIEPSHPDILSFLESRKNNGNELERARDLFTAVWVSDLFMQRVKGEQDWSLFCPHECPGLSTCFGDEYVKLYESYEKAGRARKVVPARTIWNAIVTSQIETGTPYLVNKDTVNQKSNQSNIGVIKSSNLCVAPETLILTEEGYLQIWALHGLSVNVWNGEEFSKVLVAKTATDQPMLDLLFSNGLTLTCTPEHKFYVMDEGKAVQTTAADLTPEHRLEPCRWPVLQGHALHNIKQPYATAIDCSDPELVPLKATVSCRLEFLAGYLDGCSTISQPQNGIQITTANAEILRMVLLMLQTLGVGVNNYFNINRVHCAIIEWCDIQKLVKLGLRSTRLKLHEQDLDADGLMYPKFVQLASSKPSAKNSDTYCFTEPKRGRGIFGGILAGNCAEITLFTSKDEIAVCNLASINVSAFVKEDGSYDFQGLADAASEAALNLNRVIDVNYYPTEETRRSNMRHRPIGIGQQGLADTFFKMRYAFDSPKALQLSTDIAEAIYYGAVRESVRLAEVEGPYSSFKGSHASQGDLQYKLWDKDHQHSGRFDWTALEADVTSKGLRNSMLTAIMPTASTSAILGRVEACEALASNVYVRRTGSGEFTMLNQYLVEDLVKLDLWTPSLVNQMIADNGSVQQLDIPDELKAMYKTTWELKQKVIIDQAAARGRYVDQSNSMNLFIESPSLGKVTSALFYAWSKGLKTLVYYLRSRPRADAIKFTVDKEEADKSRKAAVLAAQRAINSQSKFAKAEKGSFCTREMMEAGCESCSG